MAIKGQEMLDTSHHRRRMQRRMKDPGFRESYERAQREIAQVDAVIRNLDALRAAKGLSKAELARSVARNPSSIRRLFTQDASPELILIAQIAEELDADIKVVPRKAADRRHVKEPEPA
jgi:ribosome-binding protein aMBF1 (putative translation factor)